MWNDPGIPKSKNNNYSLSNFLGSFCITMTKWKLHFKKHAHT